MVLDIDNHYLAVLPVVGLLTCKATVAVNLSEYEVWLEICECSDYQSLILVECNFTKTCLLLRFS